MLRCRTYVPVRSRLAGDEAGGKRRVACSPQTAVAAPRQQGLELYQPRSGRHHGHVRIGRRNRSDDQPVLHVAAVVHVDQVDPHGGTARNHQRRVGQSGHLEGLVRVAGLHGDHRDAHLTAAVGHRMGAGIYPGALHAARQKVTHLRVIQHRSAPAGLDGTVGLGEAHHAAVTSVGSVAVRADGILTHRADSILTRGLRPTASQSGVDKSTVFAWGWLLVGGFGSLGQAASGVAQSGLPQGLVGVKAVSRAQRAGVPVLCPNAFAPAP